MCDAQVSNDIPVANSPAGLYASYRIVGQRLYISGQTARVNEVVKYKGKIGEDLNLEQGYVAAKICAENVLAQVNKAVQSDFSRVKSVLKLGVYLQTQEGFTRHADIANGASEVLINILGSQGEHCRTTIGVSSLPSHSAVEVDAIFELENI